MNSSQAVEAVATDNVMRCLVDLVNTVTSDIHLIRASKWPGQGLAYSLIHFDSFSCRHVGGR